MWPREHGVWRKQGPRGANKSPTKQRAVPVLPNGCRVPAAHERAQKHAERGRKEIEQETGQSRKGPEPGQGESWAWRREIGWVRAPRHGGTLQVKPRWGEEGAAVGDDQACSRPAGDGLGCSTRHQAMVAIRQGRAREGHSAPPAGHNEDGEQMLPTGKGPRAAHQGGR